jgi:hypothetical protein
LAVRLPRLKRLDYQIAQRTALAGWRRATTTIRICDAMHTLKGRSKLEATAPSSQALQFRFRSVVAVADVAFRVQKKHRHGNHLEQRAGHRLERIELRFGLCSERDRVGGLIGHLGDSSRQAVASSLVGSVPSGTLGTIDPSTEHFTQTSGGEGRYFAKIAIFRHCRRDRREPNMMRVFS